MKPETRILTPADLEGISDAKLLEYKKLATRYACMVDLFYLATEVLGYKDLTPALHQPLCDIVQSINPLFKSIAEGEKNSAALSGMKFLEPPSLPDRFKTFSTWDETAKTRLFLMFRGSFKTTSISIAHTIQLMLLWPDIRILISSHKKDGGSAEILGAIKHHFMRNEKFRALFPEYCPKPNSLGQIEWGTSERVTLPNRSAKAVYPEATIEIAGATTDVTGRHYDYIKADDLVTRESVTNESMLAKTDEFNALLKFLFNQPEWGVLDYIGTPYHFADLYSTIRKQKGVTKVVVPIQDSTGEPTFPERFSREGITKIKEDSGMSSYVFSCQYNLNPVPEEDQTFRPEWWDREGFYYDRTPENLRVSIFVDPANSQNKKSDYTALFVVGIDEKGAYWVLDLVRDKLDVEGRAKMALGFAIKHGIHKINYESVGFQNTDAYIIRKLSQEKRHYIEVNELKSTVSSKEDRIRALQPIFERGMIHLPRRYDYYSSYHKRTINMVEAFNLEAWMFPKNEHDDMIDCLSQLCRITMYSPSKTSERGKEDEFDTVRTMMLQEKNIRKPSSRYNPTEHKTYFPFSVKRSWQKMPPRA